MITVRNRIAREDALLGVVRAEGVDVGRLPQGFDEALAAVLAARGRDLSPEEEDLRQAVRDLLRNGRYKPTGRGKPASEYLIRAARRGDAFPRINGPVDVNNFVSLKHLLPASLWDLDRAESDAFVFRLGRSGEAYVFNAGGQTIDLEDLVVGCRVGDGGDEPLVNPVKDSMRTKTTAETARVGACIYAPAGVVSDEQLEAACAEFAALLAGCGDAVDVAQAVVRPGAECRL